MNDAEPVARYIEYPVFNVTDVKFLPYRNKRHQKEEDGKEEEKVIEMLQRSYMNGNFYFSYKEDITCTLVEKEQRKGSGFNQFVWNAKLLEPFVMSNVHRCWTIPIIQGFVAEIAKTTTYFNWEYLSISRRSTFMSGRIDITKGLVLTVEGWTRKDTLLILWRRRR